MRRRTLAASLAALAAVAGCAGAKGNDDTFVAGGAQISAWAVTADGRLKVPLANGLGWGAPALGKAADSTLLKVRGDLGPTFVVVARIDDAPKPLTLAGCAAAHADRIAKAVSSANVFTSPPTVSEELRRGERVPRVHYVVPLQSTAGVRGAAAMSWWTYFLDRERCLAVGVTSVVHEKTDDPQSPDPEDLHRHERVFSLLLEATTLAE